MKDSGYKWIGQIPDDWKVERLKGHFTFGKGLPITKADLIEEGAPVISYGQIHSKANTGVKLDDSLERFVSKDFINSNPQSLVEEGDFIFADTSEDVEGCGACVYVDKQKELFAGYHTIIARSNNKQNNKYFAYLFLTDNWRSQIREKVDGVKLFSTTQTILKQTYILLPPQDQQKKIADFLDTKCSELQAAIDNTKQTIEEYKKLKQAVITKVVTKGLEPNRKMKDSGIEWIGEIPENWEVCKVRHLGSLQNGISKGGDSFGKGFPFVSYGDVYKNYSIPEKVIGLVETDEEEQERYSVQKGDIFFTRTSETIEEVGFSSVCEKTIDKATFAGFLIRLRPSRKEIDTGYAKYYFRSNHNRYYLVKEMNLVTRASLGQGLLNDMPVCYPPLSEQKSIAEYLDSKCSQIDTLISQKEQFITELEKYKQSLIYEYVTGKRVLN